MRASFRFAIGFAVGCGLSFCALLLAGAGHGTYTPLAANAPMFAIIPDAGILVALVGTPPLWAIYFAVIPGINSRILRVVALALVALVHLGSGVWMFSQDSHFARVFDYSPWLIIFYVSLLVAAVIALGVLAAPGTKSARQS